MGKFHLGTAKQTIGATSPQFCGIGAHLDWETHVTVKVTFKLLMFVYFYDLELTISALMMACFQVEIYLYYCHGELMA